MVDEAQTPPVTPSRADWLRQMEREEVAVTEGAERFRRRLEQATTRGVGSTVGATKSLLHSGLTGLEDAIVAFLSDPETRKTRRVAAKWLTKVGAEVSAYLTLKTVLDRTASGGVAPVGSVALELSRRLLDELTYRRLRASDPQRFDYALQYGRSLKQRASKLRTEVTRVGVPVVEFDLPASQRLLLGTALIDLLVTSSGWFEVGHLAPSPAKRHTQLAMRLTNEKRQALANDNALLEALAEPVIAPMVVRPLDWAPGVRGGYRFALRDRFPLIRGYSRSQERSRERHTQTAEMPEVYAALNRLQSTPFRINRRMLALCRDIVDLGGAIAGLPRSYDAPLPDVLDTNDEALVTAYRKARAKVRAENYERATEAAKVSRVLAVAESVRDEVSIYFPHNLDSRSRVYPLASYLSSQGSDLERSLLLFAEAKPVDAIAREYLELTGANLMAQYEGVKLTKLTRNERIAWVRDHTADIRAAALDPIGSFFWQRADKPLQFIAWAMDYSALLDAEERGETTYCSALLCHQDGSNNGLAHYAALALDAVGARAVNMLPASTRPEDLYAEGAESVLRKLHAEAETGDQLARLWLTRHAETGIVDRKLVKRPCLTYGYGSGRFGFAEQIAEYLRSLEAWPEIREHFSLPDADGVLKSKTGAAASLLARLIWESLQEDVAVSAHTIMSWLHACAKGIPTPIEWVTPVGFPVRQDYFAAKAFKAQTVLYGRAISLNCRRDTAKVDRRRSRQALPPNVIHSLDAAHLFRTVNALADNGVTSVSTVHDSFAVCAADSATLARVLREEFIRLYTERDVLADLHRQLAAQWPDPRQCPDPPAKGTLDLHGILDQPYFFS